MESGECGTEPCPYTAAVEPRCQAALASDLAGGCPAGHRPFARLSTAASLSHSLWAWGSVNCYLLQSGDGYVLIATGAPTVRGILSRDLESLGCQVGSLRLIVLTRGDLDHIGAAHIRTAFGSKIAVHADDGCAAEAGGMSANRNKSKKPALNSLIGDRDTAIRSLTGPPECARMGEPYHGIRRTLFGRRNMPTIWRLHA